MHYAVILTLDPATTARINRVSDTIRVAALVASGPGAIPPHVTLGLLETSDEPRMVSSLRALAGVIHPFPLPFSSLGCFPGERAVIFAAPVATADLLTTHRRFSDALVIVDPGNDGLYRPGKWVPHCTLAMDLGPDQIDQAFTAARELRLPFVGSAIGIGIVRLAAAEIVVSLPFNSVDVPA